MAGAGDGKYTVKQEMERGVEGKMVCKQRYKGRDGDEDLSEDAIVQSLGGGGGAIWENAAPRMPKW